jgi:hypothetical protein
MHFGLDKIFVITKPQQLTVRRSGFALRRDSSHEAPVDLFLRPIADLLRSVAARCRFDDDGAHHVGV